ncbi:alpha/beta-hydrolase [Wilcoxina mikolae CBS 423.85]|nr:alpha/beta-hydrolase [Wilcoxina mikolae CBS 423.85]
MALIPIDPYDDSRVTHRFSLLNGRKYHYVHGHPKRRSRATILLIHGFPDLWYSWRFIIPELLEMGMQIIAPDMIGYGQTEMPKVPPETLASYSWKSSADDMAELMRQLNVPKVIVLGHDWGGAIASRIYIYHPEMVTHIASMCTPFYGLLKSYIPVEEVVKRIPSFTYQIAFNEPQTEEGLKSNAEMSRFFCGLHRGLRDEFTGQIQVRSNILKSIGDQPRGLLLTQKDLDYYIEQYSENGFHGPLNWYKIRLQNYLDEKDLERFTIDVPYLYVAATHDVATPPSMAFGQAVFIPSLTTREIKSSHWMIVECPDEVNQILREWIEGVCMKSQMKL